MLQIGIPILQITALTNLSKSTIHRHHNKAIRRGYNPKVSMLIHISYVEDAKRSGRPKTSQAVIDLVLATGTVGLRGSHVNSRYCDQSLD